MKIGQVCVKISGRETDKLVVVVDKVDSKFVLIDGNVKRRNCNINHLMPLKLVLDIKKGASTAEVHKQMSANKLEVVGRKPKKEKKKEDIEVPKKKPVKKRAVSKKKNVKKTK